MPQFRLAAGDEQRDFEVTRQGDRIHVAADGLSADVHVLASDGRQLLLEVTRPDGTRRRVRVAGTRIGDRRQLWVDGRAVSLERVRRRREGARAEGSLSASIPAVVSQILVNAGDLVSAGDKLILLESMKMVIPIQAPFDGTVVRVACAVGDSVPAGLPLLEIEPQ